jgi:4-aminobutyrate aminotransferase/(S)-3-amino-2-methylpropionate transaminase
MDISNKTKTLSQRRAAAVPKGPFNVTPYFAQRASGAVLVDVDGRELIDFAGGIGVLNVGHCHPRVVAAIKDQAEKYIHTCFHIVMYEPYIELAERLCAFLPGEFSKMAMFANSGAEAVENAVKIARHFKKRPGIIAFDHGFHGRTLLGMSLTSKVKPYKVGFGPFASDIYRMPYPYCYRCPFGLQYPGCQTVCADYLKDFFVSHVAPEDTAALIIEPLTGEGGLITPPPEYFPKLQQITRDNDVLFIADEIQTGLGRTGRMFALEHWGVEADMVTLGKSLAAGLPLSAVVGKKELLDEPQVGGLGGTYGGNPICCRAALAVLDIFQEENLLEKSRALGRKIKQRFVSWQEEFHAIGEIRGLGPMLGLELVEDRDTKQPGTEQARDLIKFCYEHGLILLSCGSFGNVIRTLMPLVITDEQLERGLAIMEEGLSVLCS